MTARVLSPGATTIFERNVLVVARPRWKLAGWLGDAHDHLCPNGQISVPSGTQISNRGYWKWHVLSAIE